MLLSSDRCASLQRVTKRLVLRSVPRERKGWNPQYNSKATCVDIWTSATVFNVRQEVKADSKRSKGTGQGISCDSTLVFRNADSYNWMLSIKINSLSAGTWSAGHFTSSCFTLHSPFHVRTWCSWTPTEWSPVTLNPPYPGGHIRHSRAQPSRVQSSSRVYNRFSTLWKVQKYDEEI